MDDLNTLREELMAAVNGATDTAALEEARISALGKKGRLSVMIATRPLVSQRIVS